MRIATPAVNHRSVAASFLIFLHYCFFLIIIIIIIYSYSQWPMRPIVTDRVAGLSVGLSVCHTSELCKNG